MDKILCTVSKIYLDTNFFCKNREARGNEISLKMKGGMNIGAVSLWNSGLTWSHISVIFLLLAAVSLLFSFPHIFMIQILLLQNLTQHLQMLET